MVVALKIATRAVRRSQTNLNASDCNQKVAKTQSKFLLASCALQGRIVLALPPTPRTASLIIIGVGRNWVHSLYHNNHLQP